MHMMATLRETIVECVCIRVTPMVITVAHAKLCCFPFAWNRYNIAESSM